jgi:transcription initiation factor TFIIIB Brf1 subunit/transcription initiation factor TFIIB
MAELASNILLSSVSSLSSSPNANLSSGSSVLDHHAHAFIQDIPSGQIVCKNCGWVKETHIVVNGWERPHFIAPSALPSRASKSLQTLTLRRALRLDRNKTWAVRKIEIGSHEIQRLSASLELGDDVTSRAGYLFRKAVMLPRFQIHYTLLIARVCFFYTAKMTKTPVRLEVILNDGLYSTKLGYRYYTILLHDLHLPHPVANPSDFLQIICSKLKLDPDVCHTAKRCLVPFLNQTASSGCNMRGIAGGAVYLACKILQIPISQQKIARVVGISDITLRTRFKEIYKVFQKTPGVL